LLLGPELGVVVGEISSVGSSLGRVEVIVPSLVLSPAILDAHKVNVLLLRVLEGSVEVGVVLQLHSDVSWRRGAGGVVLRQ